MMRNKIATIDITKQIINELEQKSPITLDGMLKYFVGSVNPYTNYATLMEHTIPILVKYHNFSFIGGMLFFNMYEEKIRKTLMIKQREFWVMHDIYKDHLIGSRARFFQLHQKTPKEVYGN